MFVPVSLRGVSAVIAFVLLGAAPLLAQPPASDQQAPPHQHTPPADPAPASPPAQDPHAGHTMPMPPASGGVTMPRERSGTAWLPTDSPMYMLMGQAGGWGWMFHENVFVQALHDSGDRGDTQGGSINWFMGMAYRPLGAGRLTLRGMTSLEPWTIPGCGYPNLLASGEECEGRPIHDRQHPHDLAMEIAAQYDAPLGRGLTWQVYGGPAAEPALGPVAFPHRVSAMPNPLSPIAHHWLDATHITFGVVTGAVYATRWKAEASVFNGREPDEDRTDIDFAALDSVSGRLWFLPTRRWALQVSSGRLTDGGHAAGGGHATITRTTASATYHRPLGTAGVWATTMAWGRNAEPDHASQAWLFETVFTPDDLRTWYGRVELAGKSPGDLDLPPLAERFDVSKLQAGYTRYLRAWRGFNPGVGGSLSVGIVPDDLRGAYGRRANVGLGIYLTLRPARHAM